MQYSLIQFVLLGLLTLWGGETLLSRNTTAQMIDGNLHSLKLKEKALRSAFSPDGTLLVATDDRGKLQAWRTDNWALIAEIDHPGPAYGPLVSPDSKVLVTGTAIPASGGRLDETIWFWNVETGALISSLQRMSVNEVYLPMAFSPDGQFLVLGSDTGNVKVLDVSSPTKLRVAHEKRGLFNHSLTSAVSFSPDGKYFAVATVGVPLIVFDTETGKEVFNYRGIQNSYQITFSPDGKTLAIAGKLWRDDDRRLTVRLFSTNSWQMENDLQNHDGTNGLRFTSDNRSLILVGQQTIVVYDLKEKKSSKRVNNKYTIGAASIDVQNRRVAFADSLGKTVKVLGL